MGLSVVIVTNKKTNQFPQTLRSVSFADETVIVHDDRGRGVIADFAAQRNLGLSKAKNDWVLFVDDDEIVSESLASEIKQAIKNDRYSGYYLRRLDRYHGQTLKHGETGNTRIIRLGRKDAGNFTRPVHEVWQIRGRIGFLNHSLIHERGDLVSPFIDRMIHYCPLDANALKLEGKPYSSWRVVVNPTAKFITNYLVKLGFLDGLAGLFQAYLMSIQSLTVRVFQWPQN